jgi:cytochrome c biogenesis protein CcmG/thiol:disulfide interchange protein DsbE
MKTSSKICLIYLLLSSIQVQAVTFNELSKLSKDMQYGYVLGSVSSMLVDSDISGSYRKCMEKYGFDDAWDMLSNYLKKSPEPASGQINVAVLIGLLSPKKCPNKSNPPNTKTLISFLEFTHLPKDSQTGYVVGVFESFIVNAKYTEKRTSCVEKYGAMELWNYMLDLYNKNQSDAVILNSSPAQILLDGVSTKCGNDKIFDPKLTSGQGTPIPEFTLTRVINEKEEVTTADLIGQPTVIIFWATWVGDKGNSDLNNMRSLVQRGVNVVTVNHKDSRSLAASTLNTVLKNDLSKTLDIFDPEGELGNKLGVIGVPAMFMIDSSGIIKKKWFGAVTPKIWKDQLEGLYTSFE